MRNLIVGKVAANYNYLVYSSFDTLNTVLYEDTHVGYDVLTLLWKPDGRHFCVVGNISQHAEITLTADVFPNSRFGFNQRRLLVATNLLEPACSTVSAKSPKVIALPGFPRATTSDCPSMMSASNRKLDSVGEIHLENPLSQNLGLHRELLQKMVQEVSKNGNLAAILFMQIRRYNITEPADGEWGVLNGSWTGLIGMLARKEVDVVVAPLARLFEREQVVDFTAGYFVDYARFVYMKQSPPEDKWWTYLAPFKWEVHLSLLGVFLGVCAIALLIEQFHPRRRANRNATGRLDIFWGFLGHLLRQARVIGGSWLFFTTITAAVYSGNLIAFLTVNKEQLPFKSVKELVGQEQYKWGIPGGSAYVTHLTSSSQPEYKRLWKGILEFAETDPDVLSLYLDMHINKVLAGHYAFLLGEYATSFYFSNNCDVTYIPENSYRNIFSVALPNNSPYTAQFSERISRMTASGVLDNLKLKYITKSICNINKHSTKPAQLDDIQGAFYAVAIGVVRKLNWTNAVFVYDSSAEFSINELTVLMSNQLMTYKLVETGDNSTNIRNLIIDGAVDKYNYIVCSSADTLNTVLYQLGCDSLKIFAEDLRHWLLITMSLTTQFQTLQDVIHDYLQKGALTCLGMNQAQDSTLGFSWFQNG
ncbi:probable glutamate receptor [Gigantopelta aegis]|uniref:probable glutamate receptor n=1 Tax=Gigantopelta aegis TaxID=1735272 RepID=UPI001B887698|nr:probable glutamate receptor [Gigantopelta aegis]